MGNADRQPMRRLVEAGYAESQIVTADGTEMCWITDEGKAFLRAAELRALAAKIEGGT